MFGKKKKPLDYDRENMVPVIMCSICNGEKVAGFQDKKTGRFDEVMLIRGDKDLDEFIKIYGITSVKKIY